MAGHSVAGDVAAVEVRVSAVARAVALRRSTIVSVVGAVLTYLASTGRVSVGDSATANHALDTALTFVATVGAGAWIHAGVTPARLDLSPTASDGTPLVSQRVAVAAALSQPADLVDEPETTPPPPAIVEP